jgi:hypothetical protein
VGAVLASVGLVSTATSPTNAHAAARSVISRPGLVWSRPHPLSTSQPTTGPARWVMRPRSHAAGAHALLLTSNWAGFVATGATYTHVTANWMVPPVQPSQGFEASATWIGLDGSSSQDQTIIQTGTTQGTAGGQTLYFSWFELYPAPTVVIGLVLPGDLMSASISELSAGVWEVAIQDTTSSQRFAETFRYSGPGSTAEWIEEAPASPGGQIATLADFGAVAFNNIGVGGSNQSLASLNEVEMVDSNGQVIAYPNSFDPSTRSFSITYSGPGPQGSGYDLVGADGGVFVFPPDQVGGFYGSLPGIGVSVSNIAGMVPSPDNGGYFLVGSDGGVFAFGDAPFAGSLPGLGVGVNNIRGIVPTSDNGGYFLVGSDGGVFAFGDAPYLGSLPGLDIRVTNIIGIASTPSDQGYWLVGSDGGVFAFGDAPYLGSAAGTPSPVSGIASSPDGGGYWIVARDGSVYSFGDAGFFGSLPGIGVTPSHPVIGLVPTIDDQGYWLIGSDGGIFAFGDAPFVGSLPSLGVAISNIVGAVPTTG